MPEHAQHLPSQPGRDREPEARPELPAGGVAADDAARGADDPDGDAGDVACRALFRDAVVPVARECEAVAVAADDAVEDVAAAAAEQHHDVLGITATGADLKEARKKAYEATEWVNFANKYMRHAIENT